MTENEVARLRELELEARERFDAVAARSRQRHEELGAAKVTAPGVGPEARFELMGLTRELRRARERWQGRVRALRRAEHELALSRVLSMDVSADRPSTIGVELRRLEKEIQELRPLAYRPELGERLLAKEQEYNSLVAEYDALLEREIREVRNATR